MLFAGEREKLNDLARLYHVKMPLQPRCETCLPRCEHSAMSTGQQLLHHRPVARMAVSGSIADLRKAIERCWPAHVEEGPRFLVAGHEFEVGGYSTANIFARAPIQPARHVMPDGVAIGFVLSAFEVEVNGERTPAWPIRGAPGIVQA